jgi:type IX secretion system PorP/SprF family membrane protein
MKKILLGLLASMALSAQAQDVHFTQYFTSPMTLNPATTGLVSCDWRVAANYRSQWSAVNNTPYTTVSGSYDMGILKGKLGGDVLGVGALVMYDQSGTGQLKNTTAGLSLAYHHAFGDAEDKPTVLSVGAQGYLVNKSLNFDKLRFGDQYDPNTGGILGPSAERFNGKDLGYGDINAGAMLTGYANEKSTYYVGGSFYHITRPTETFLLVNNNPKINQRLSLSAGGNIQMNDNMLLLASAMWQKQGPAQEVLLGGAAGFIMNPMHDEYSANSVLFLGTWYRLGDAICPYVGFEWGKSKLAFSYDVTVSSFAAATKSQGAVEISFVYNGCIVRNETKKYNFACPRF